MDFLKTGGLRSRSIDEALKKALAKNGVNNSKSSACKNAKVRRFRNYRRIRNEDGTVSIEVNIDEGNDVPDVTHITAEPVEPVAEYVPEENVDVVVDGRDVPLDNARTAKRVRNTAVKNEGGDAALDPPTTFPSK